MLRLTIGGLVISILIFVQRAEAQVATFENFSEGFFSHSPMLDPASGISFYDQHPNYDILSIDFAGPTSGNLNRRTGNILTDGTWADGPGFAEGLNFFLEADFPHATNRTSVDITSSPNGSGAQLTLSGYNASNSLVAQQTFTPPSGNFVEQNYVLQSSSANIWSLRITMTNVFTAYDNIAVPEPALLGPLALAAIAMRRARLTTHRSIVPTR